MRTRMAALAVSFLVVLGLAAAPPASAATGVAATVFSLTNDERTKAGLKPLMSDLALDAAAQEWARYLSSSCTFQHSTSSWRSTRTRPEGWTATGENIAAGYESAAAVVKGWMGSTGHRANILDSRYTGMGIGYTSGRCYSTYWVQVFGIGKSAGNPGAGDMNGDATPDVIAVTSEGEVLSYRTTGRGTWFGAVNTGTRIASEQKLVSLGDFSGDGVGDIGRIDANGDFVLLQGTGGATYTNGGVIGSGWAQFTELVGGIDFDRDGRTDVIARASDGTLRLYRGNGRGGWLSGVRQIGSGWQGFTSLHYVGDFDGDGYGDIMARSADGLLRLYPSNGSGGWRSARVIGSGWASMTAILSPGDFDGNGTVDVLARTPAGALVLYRGNGRGGWSGSVTVGSGWQGFRQVE